MSVPGEYLGFEVSEQPDSRLGVQTNVELQLQVVVLFGSIQVQLDISHLLNQPLLGVFEAETQSHPLGPLKILLIQSKQ